VYPELRDERLKVKHPGAVFRSSVGLHDIKPDGWDSHIEIGSDSRKIGIEQGKACNLNLKIR
jgi:hypothetical protein